MTDAVFGAIAFVVALFLSIIAGALMGALVGLIVGWFFSGAINNTLIGFGVNTGTFQMWEFGALLGFVAGFFRSNVSVTKQ